MKNSPNAKGVLNRDLNHFNNPKKFVIASGMCLKLNTNSEI